MASVSLAGSTALLLLLAQLCGCGVVEYQKRWFDKDQDGIANAEDRCPDSAAGDVVNRRGCNLFDGVLQGVSFETDDKRLNASSKRALDELVLGLRSRPGTVIGVHAHTDNRGKAVKNLELSKQRVMQVVAYLVERGVQGRQLKPYGYGESRPRVSNATQDGRRANRRIEVVLLEKGEPTGSASDPDSELVSELDIEPAVDGANEGSAENPVAYDAELASLP